MITRIAAKLCFCLWHSGVQAVAEPVRVAYAEVFPPFTELRDGEAEGLAVDILRAAAARVGVNIELVPVPFEQIQWTLADGRAQAIFPLTITPERLPSFDFSTPILITGGALFVRTPYATPENLAALSGKIVVTPRTGPLAAFIQKNAPSVKLVITTDYEEGLARLVKGEADAAALGFHVGIRLTARLYPSQVTEPRSMFTELPFAIAVSKGREAEFLARLNAGLAEIRTDGTWQQINNRWMGNESSGVSSTHRFSRQAVIKRLYPLPPIKYRSVDAQEAKMANTARPHERCGNQVVSITRLNAAQPRLMGQRCA